MSTVQSNLRGVLIDLRNAGVFDSIQASDEGVCVTRGQWTMQYWVGADDGVKWFATNAADVNKTITGQHTASDYRALLVEILNSMVGHFPADEMVADEVQAGDMDKSYIGRTVTIPWTFRGHEATITGVLESVKHDAYGTCFEMENTSNHHHEYVFRCVSDPTVIIHPDNPGEESD